MKIERIDDNSIRCTLTSLDLSSRNINLRDMTYGSLSAKRLFSEMMQKAQDEVGFSVNGVPLMIEAVPLQGGALQLIITKVEDPEEIDTRFTRFTNNADQNNWISQLASQILEGAQDLMKQIHDQKENESVDAQADSTPAVETDAAGDSADTENRPDQVRIFRFLTLDRVLDASHVVGEVFGGENSLYKDENRRRYYLVLHSEGRNLDEFNRASNLLSEFGDKLNGTALNEAYYNEHYELMVKDQAVQKLEKV